MHRSTITCTPDREAWSNAKEGLWLKVRDRIAVQQPDTNLAAAGKADCGKVRDVSQFLDRGLDCFDFAGATLTPPLMTRDTVIVETPARLVTSLVAGPLPERQSREL